MAKLYVLFFALLSSTAFSQTYFDYIGEKFYYGERPNVEEIESVPWTGRCFRRETPNTPSNIGLYIREKEGGEDTGPINLKQYQVANYTFNNRPANFLDDKDHDYLAPFIERLYETLNITQHEFTYLNRQSGQRVWVYVRKEGNFLYQSFYNDYGLEGKIRCYYWSTNAPLPEI